MLQYVNVRNHNAIYNINVPYDVEALFLSEKQRGVRPISRKAPRQICSRTGGKNLV